MVTRSELGVTWTQSFNAENRLNEISDGTDTWSFVYDGDGNRVKQGNPDGSVTLFLGGGIYTVEDAAGNPAITKYYAIAGQRMAMDDGSGLQYLLTDHLGSVVAVTNPNGSLVTDSEQRYMPFGEPRLAGSSPTDFTYTGQRSLADVGLMDYNARWYDAALGRFVSADSLVPGAGNPQAFNRYAYVVNNPVLFTDPSGNSAGDFNGSIWVLEDPGNPRLCTGLACWGGSVSITTPTGGGGGNGGGGGAGGDGDGEVDGDLDLTKPDPEATIDPIPTPFADYADCALSDYLYCLYKTRLFKDFETVDLDPTKFRLMLYAIYLDLQKRDNYFSFAGGYDTPFWNAYGAVSGNVCYENYCYDRTEVNYVAQGMAAADSGISQTTGHLIVRLYKLPKLNIFPNEELYWFDFGYSAYSYIQNTKSIYK